MAEPGPVTIRDTRLTVTRQMGPQDANIYGNVHGGVILKMIDEVAGLVAQRHARSVAVTASIDRMDFHAPVYIGNVLHLKAALNLTGNTSMEVGVRVEAEDPLTGKVVHAGTAFLTYVALDKNGKPMAVRPVAPADEEERHWQEGARRRRELRMRMLGRR